MRIAVIFPSFLGGGAESVCAWILEALKDRDITLITLSDISLRDLNVQYGTSLTDSRVNAHVARLPLPRTLREKVIKSLSGFSFRQFYLSWYYRNFLSKRFNLAISAFNEMDLGLPGIQYIHLPMFAQGHETLRPVVGHPESSLRRAYKRALKIVTGWSEKRLRNNVTVTNSQWTARWIEKIWGLRARVVYPPVVWDTEIKPWDQRENGFVLISRIVREKKIEKAIKILQEVRSFGYDFHLRILGGIGDITYLKELQQRFGLHDWLIWEKRLERSAYEHILSSYKYGIHARENEQFGIGVAEMVRAGIIPFVPDQGGQAEIVDHDPRLCWDNEADAVGKIVKVLNDPSLQEELRSKLSMFSQRFSAENFVTAFRQVVEEFESAHV
ncbi:hypothetical protein HRbin37_02003 [bacterium HR37]|nr:hypothetical protein HRbin37_02003 [bacterium HR37]